MNVDGPDPFLDGVARQQRRSLAIVASASLSHTGPDGSMRVAQFASARGGIDVAIILRCKNNSWIVGVASSSGNAEPFAAGAAIFACKGRLLRTKALNLGAGITFVGSANLDGRSFGLNYENEISLYGRALTRAMRERQRSYLLQSRLLNRAMIADRSWCHGMTNHAIAMPRRILWIGKTSVIMLIASNREGEQR